MFGLSRPLDSLREASDCCTIAISQHRLPAVTHHMQGAVREMSECDARCNLQDDVDKMSVKELKAFLQSRSVNTRSILEKSELRDRVKALL